MHFSSFEHMGRLVKKYLNPDQALTILDIGSCDVNGSYRELFLQPSWQYIGIDAAAGKNVDVILESPYRLPFPTEYADCIVSGQTFEHIEFFWLSWLEIVRVLKCGGQIILIAPSRGVEHKYPVDCWRFYPDGFNALAKYAGIELIEVHTDWIPHQDRDSSIWGDTAGVFVKPMTWSENHMFSNN